MIYSRIYIALAALLAVISCALVHVDAHGSYYLPGVSPHTYKQYEQVKLFVSKLTSTKTQLPYDYYSLPYCAPKNAHMESENLGELFSGDRIENSVYNVESKVNKACEVACRRKLTKDQKKAFERAIEDDYQVHWILDSLPVGMYSQQPKAEKDSAINRPSFSRGFPVGFKTTSGTKSKYYLNNHIRIIIQYHDDFESFSPEDVTTKVVGFVAEPMSIRHNFADKTVTSCPTSMSDSKDFKGANGLDKSEVVFTYEVIWQQSDTEWSNRWDLYLTVTNPEEKVHWFSITNAILVILLLTSLLAVILVRALYRDIAKYNESDDESGWKLVHADVFRPPADFPMLFCVFVGTGFQLGLMSLATLSFALLGLLSPANRGSLGTAFILLFVFMGSFAGFYSSSTYKMFRGADWKQITLVTAFLFPGIVFTVFFGLNIVMWAEGSSAALPFSTFFTLLFLWFCVSVPLVFVGSFVGFKKETVAYPVRINQIPRAIPPQPWYMNPVIVCIFGGILPFGAVSVELYFIMSALWLHQIYYIFGFMFICMVILVITCAETSILLCYFQLCNEDYHWWWRSFISSGACAFYTMLYSVWYNLTELNLTGFVSQFVYFGYMSLICFTFFLVTGTIGFVSCFWFNLKIYGSIKVD